IEGLPKTPNTLLGRSWFVRSAHAKKWLNLVALKTNRQRPDYPLEKAELTLTRYSSIEPDFDGLCGSFKAVLDALVKLGVLKDDKPSNIGQPSYKWEKVNPNSGKIKVRIKQTKEQSDVG